MTSREVPITSSELANLWMTYQEKTMLLRMLEHFIEHADVEAKPLLQMHYDSTIKAVDLITEIFKEEGAAIPIGFTANDVNNGIPKLFDFLFDIMYLHMMTKVEMSLFSLFCGISYREDINNLFISLTAESQAINNQVTQYLLKKGVLVRPPFVSMPKEVHFVQENQYRNGFGLLGEKRSLNTIEVSLIHHAIETNLVGMQLMIGFAQVAENKAVQDYLVKGMKLSKKSRLI